MIIDSTHKDKPFPLWLQ